MSRGTRDDGLSFWKTAAGKDGASFSLSQRGGKYTEGFPFSTGCPARTVSVFVTADLHSFLSASRSAAVAEPVRIPVRVVSFELL
jgi:hypothetical protein